MKAGTAQYKLNITPFNKEETIKTTLDFKTTSFFDKIYKMRDTLESYASLPEIKPLYLFRSVNEGNTKYKEEMYINKYSSSYSEIRIKKIKEEVVVVDTTLTINNTGYDILNLFLFLRTLDYEKLNTDDTFRHTIFLGEYKTDILIRYHGQSVIDRSDSLKYKSLKFEVDITHDVFTESKRAIEVWISDDGNKIPLKIKAKLKIGAVEANISSHTNLKYSLTSEIIIPPRK